MKVFQYIAIFLLTMVLGACSKDNDPTPVPPSYRHTTIIYMSAQNNLCSAADLDFQEIKDGAKLLQHANDNIIVYLDDAQNPRIYHFNLSNSSNQNPQPVKIYDTDLNSSNPSTLTDVLNFVASNYHSQSYGLVLWSHGMGWLPNITSFDGSKSKSYISVGNTTGFGIDVGTNGNIKNNHDALGKLGEQMEIPALASAIKNSSIRPEYIFFDACNMQCVEVAYALKDVTHYIIASPCTTSGYGIYYTHMIPNGFFAYPFTADSIKQMANIYYYDVMENPVTKSLYEGQGCVMSVIKTSGLDTLAVRTAQYLPQVIQNKAYPNLSGVQTYNNFERTTEKFPDYFDIHSAMHKLLPSTQYQLWLNTLKACVIHTCASSEFYHYSEGIWPYIESYDYSTSCGVSMFFPQNVYNNYTYYGNLNEMFTTTQWYQVAGWQQCGW